MRLQKITIKDCKEIARMRGGECLSISITNTKEKLKWRCTHGHEWESRIDHIRSGSWCPVCARSKTAQKRRLGMDEMRQLVHDKGGQCLSEVYTNNNTHLEWQCSEGHRWKAKPSNIKLGKWCPYCAGVKKKSIEEIQAYCVKKGGVCLSDSYSDIKSKLKFKCKEGHEWEASTETILSGGWCPKCADKIRAEKKRHNIEIPIKLAKEKNGKLLSKSYKNANTPLLWQCENEHQWKASFANVQTGTWCPYCAGKIVTIEDVNKTVNERGGKLLSKEYISAKTKLDLICGNGHKFKMSWDVIKRGSWCPQCTASIGERICREYFEKIFDCEFPKSFPKWLISSKGFQLELDGYSESKAIAFEHHGRQHYRIESIFYKQESEFNHRLKLDAEKENLCINHGVKLIKIPEIPLILPMAEVFPFLKNELEKLGLKITKNENELNINWQLIYTPPQNEKFLQIQKIAKSRNGECLSIGYLNNKTKMKFRCEHGHEWEAQPTSIIIQGTWCRICAYNKRIK